MTAESQNKTKKGFDCVAFQREQRDRVSRMLNSMTREKRVDWLCNVEITDPILSAAAWRERRVARSAQPVFRLRTQKSGRSKGMTANAEKKDFDCVAFQRAQRDKLRQDPSAWQPHYSHTGHVAM